MELEAEAERCGFDGVDAARAAAHEDVASHADTRRREGRRVGLKL